MTLVIESNKLSRCEENKICNVRVSLQIKRPQIGLLCKKTLKTTWLGEKSCLISPQTSCAAWLEAQQNKKVLNYYPEYLKGT